MQILWVNLVTAVTPGSRSPSSRPSGHYAPSAAPPARAPALAGLVLADRPSLGALRRGRFGMFRCALDWAPVEIARTIAVNALVVIEISTCSSSAMCTAPR